MILDGQLGVVCQRCLEFFLPVLAGKHRREGTDHLTLVAWVNVRDEVEGKQVGE